MITKLLVKRNSSAANIFITVQIDANCLTLMVKTGKFHLTLNVILTWSE